MCSVERYHYACGCIEEAGKFVQCDVRRLAPGYNLQCNSTTDIKEELAWYGPKHLPKVSKAVVKYSHPEENTEAPH